MPPATGSSHQSACAHGRADVLVDRHVDTDFDVVVLGSLNLDLVAKTSRLPGPGETVSGHSYREFPGGKGLNQAVAAARAGASVAFIGAVGDDEAGRRLRAIAVAEGIDDRWILTASGAATGRAMITVDDDAENVIVVIPGANAELTWPDDAPACRVLLTQLEVPVDVVAAALAEYRTAGTTTILNPAPADEVDERVVRHCTIVVPNEHELALLGSTTTLLASGTQTVVVTRGAAGATVHEANGSTSIDAFEVVAVDTTGAGDAFCGNLAARLSADDAIGPAVRWACAAGALAATTDGAVPSLPHADTVRALLEQQ